MLGFNQASVGSMASRTVLLANLTTHQFAVKHRSHLGLPHGQRQSQLPRSHRVGKRESSCGGDLSLTRCCAGDHR